MTSTLQLQIVGPGKGIAWGHIGDQPLAVQPDGTVDNDWDERAANPWDNIIDFQKVEKGKSYVLVRAPGWKDLRLEFDMPADGNHEVRMEREAPSRLEVRGRWFHRKSDGKRVWLFGYDCYTGYQRWLDGERGHLQEVFEQLASKGCKVIRVFGMHATMSEQIGKSWLTPAYTNYYDGIRGFCQFAGSYGFTVYWVGFADVARCCPNVDSQPQVWDKVCTELEQEPNVVGSAGNELRQHDNFVDVTKLRRPSFPCSAGSEGLDTPTYGPWWDFDEFHPRRDYKPSSIKDCNIEDQPNYVSHGGQMGVMLDEGIRGGDGPNANRDADWLAGQAAAAFSSAMGYFVHTQEGVWSNKFSPYTESCVDAVVERLHPEV